MTARPLLVGVAEVRRAAGVRHPVHVRAQLDGLEVSGSSVPAGATVVVDGELEAAGADVVVDAEVTAPWVGDCRRCLEPVRGELVVRVREVFERHPTEGETYRLGEESLDLEPMVRDAVLLALPVAPLCSPDCAGPDPTRFPTAPGDGRVPPGGADSHGRDPRWSALDDLRFDA